MLLSRFYMVLVLLNVAERLLSFFVRMCIFPVDAFSDY